MLCGLQFSRDIVERNGNLLAGSIAYKCHIELLLNFPVYRNTVPFVAMWLNETARARRK